MLPLKVWDDQLSKEAANWIKRCQFEHEKKGRGENLAFDSNPKKDEELINSSMKAWYDEIKDYNYAAKRCGRSCHYTQVSPASGSMNYLLGRKVQTSRKYRPKFSRMVQHLKCVN